MDCGLVTLEMYTSLPYVQIAEVAKRVTPHAHNGLWVRELLRLAWALQVKLRRLPQPEQWEEHDCGILLVSFKAERKTMRHWLLWFEGVLINPADGLVWKPDAYLASRKLVGAFVEVE